MKKTKQQLHVLSGILLIIGLGLFINDHWNRGIPVTPTKVSNYWQLEAKVKFNAKNKSIKTNLFIPHITPNYSIRDETFLSGKYGITVNIDNLNRMVVWTARKAQGQQALFYRFFITPKTASAKVSKEQMSKALSLATLSESQTKAAENIIQNVKSKSSDLDSLVNETLRLLKSKNESATALMGSDQSLENVAKYSAYILTKSGEISVVANGFILQPMASIKLKPFLAVWKDGNLIYYNLSTNKPETNSHLLIWYYGSSKIATIENGNLDLPAFLVPIYSRNINPVSFI